MEFNNNAFKRRLNFFVLITLNSFFANQAFSMMNFNQAYLATFLLICIATPLMIIPFFKLVPKSRYLSVYFWIICILSLGRIILEFTVNSLAYCIFGGLIVGGGWVIIAIGIGGGPNESLSSSGNYFSEVVQLHISFYFGAAIGFSLLLSLTINLFGFSLVNSWYIYPLLIIQILCALLLYFNEIQAVNSTKILEANPPAPNSPGENNDAQFNSQKIHDFMIKYRALYIPALILGTAGLFYSLLDVLSYPAMISARTKAFDYEYYFPILFLINFLACSYAVYVLIGFTHLRKYNNLKINQSVFNHPRIGTGVLTLNLITGGYAFMYDYIDDFALGFFAIFLFITVLFDLAAIFYLLYVLKPNMTQLLLFFFAVSLLVYGSYAVNYFFIQFEGVAAWTLVIMGLVIYSFRGEKPWKL